MTQFIITEEQRNFIIAALGEVVAKISYRPISILQGLPLCVEEKGPAQHSTE